MKGTTTLRIALWMVTLVLVAFPTEVWPQDPGNTQENLSQQAANPLADLMSFPFQNNLNINHGEFNRNVNVLIIHIPNFSIFSLIYLFETDTRNKNNRASND